MKRTIQITLGVLTLLVTSTAFAGGVIHNSNVSPEYLRTLTRNAATDSADAAHYNPAGVAWFKDGLYLSVGNQFIMKEYEHKAYINFMGSVLEYGPYKDNQPVFLFPNIFAVYKTGDLGIFGSFTVPAGGGSINYKDGALMPVQIINQPNKASGFTAHYALSAGAAYKILPWLSVGVGARMIIGQAWADVESTETTAQANDGDTLMSYELSTMGYGGVISLNARPLPNLVIAARYETVVKLDWKWDKVENPFNLEGYGPEGSERSEDLPPVLALGVSYKLFPELRLEGNMNVYFNHQTSWEWASDPTSQAEHSTGWETGWTVEYKFHPKYKASLGVLYTTSGANKEVYDTFKPALDCVTIGAGIWGNPLPNLEFNVGVTRTIYFDDELELDQDAGHVDLKKMTMALGLGVQYKF